MIALSQRCKRPSPARPSGIHFRKRRNVQQWSDRARPCSCGGSCSRCVQERETAGGWTGRPLDTSNRKYMEERFGHDFSQVRVHTDARAAASARALNARAYTTGADVVFGRDEFSPGTREGRLLLAHELAHVIQQSRTQGRVGGEREAELAANRTGGDRAVNAGELGRAPSGVQSQENEEEPAPSTAEDTSPVEVTWPEAYEIGGMPTFGGGPILLPPLPYSPGGQLGPVPERPDLSIPSPEPEGETEAGTEAPSRISLVSAGSFSFGLRLGFPELEFGSIVGAPPSALSESLARGRLIEETLTGRVPSSWERLDKGKLAQWAWGVFSTHIAPDVARSITESLSGSTGEGGVSFELDAVLFTDFSGGGLSLQLLY
ncbi:MAG TPA: DUF4157 domain-containing protein [Verrucomicrobiales bacterium]|nr:DUF4157 domain-containing protein [Verrucomicrobiales bacterium]